MENPENKELEYNIKFRETVPSSFKSDNDYLKYIIKSREIVPLTCRSDCGEPREQETGG